MLVRFQYHSPVPIKTVSIAGTFNLWNADRNFFEQTDSHDWTIEIDIPPGRHFYKLVINGSDWITDPSNPSVSEDCQNNSSITVMNDGVYIRTTGTSVENPSAFYLQNQALNSPDWIHQAVIYQLHIRAFADGTFSSLTEKMDYLTRLGINTVWIMPFHPVGHQKRTGRYGDPYAVTDFYRIDPDFGNEEALKKLIDQFHQNGIRVILDWTLNRTAADHPLTKSCPYLFTQDPNGNVCYQIPGREEFAGFDFRNPQTLQTILDAMEYWIMRFDFDGYRLDDSDITPHEVLARIKEKTQKIKKDFIILSQAYDEFHHLNSADLTYDGLYRQLIPDLIKGNTDSDLFGQTADSYTYSFPRDSIRMRWLEEKELPRLSTSIPYEALYPAAALLLLSDGVPHILMGQEFNEKTWNSWRSLFDEWKINWKEFDQKLFDHYRQLIRIRLENPVFTIGDRIFFQTGHPQVIGFYRSIDQNRIQVLISFSSEKVRIQADFSGSEAIDLEPYQYLIRGIM